MTTEKPPTEKKMYLCKICEFSTLKSNDFERHIYTNKHNKIQHHKQSYGYDCDDCGKRFNHRASLYNHLKRCNGKEKIMSTNTVMTMLKELIAQNAEFKRELIAQNAEIKRAIQLITTTSEEFHKTVIETIKTGKPNTKITFNINTFLAEKCNHAMNITDFVGSIALNLEDLERVGSVGYVDGISDIIITTLNKVDVYNRPFHCTNAAREIIFIKNDDSWIIDTNNDNMRIVIKRITKLNSDLIRHWGDINPQAKKGSHILNDKYMAILFQAMGGKGEMHDNENKIIKRIVKHITITK